MTEISTVDFEKLKTFLQKEKTLGPGSKLFYSNVLGWNLKNKQTNKQTNKQKNKQKEKNCHN